MIYKRATTCRLCGSVELVPILDLGVQSLTGVFPPAAQPDVEQGPLELVKCTQCHLVQLAHSYELTRLYGETYGYRSGLNASMVRHLTQKVLGISQTVSLGKGDVVLDIGSNDGTTLGAYPDRSPLFVGMDPSGAKFRQYYRHDVQLIPEFFSAASFVKETGRAKAKVVTSIAMFYDLEDPLGFARQVASILDDEGVWILEQSYLPAMIEALAYDTVCHEHLEYYSLHQIKRIMEAANLRVLSVEFNKVNGGSFSVTAAHRTSGLRSIEGAFRDVLQQEVAKGYHDLDVYRRFEDDVKRHRDSLRLHLERLNRQGARVHGYGASTKGNVILQYCGLGPADLEVMAEVNEEKFGRVTPGTRIPIVSEAESRARRPTHYLVFPWHFRDGIVEKEDRFVSEGGTLLFPLPQIESIPPE